MEYVIGESGGFDGQSLLDVTSDQLSVTEILHHPNEVYEKTGRVDVTKRIDTDKQIQRDLVLIQGDARVEYINGMWKTVAGSESVSTDLQAHGEQILSQDITRGETDIEYDAVTQERLEDLGYM